MNAKRFALCISVLSVLSVSAPGSAQDTMQTLQDEVTKLKAENQKLKSREKIAEVVIPRGSDQNRTMRELVVYVPENASNIQIKGYMKNEAWGGSHSPPKPNTDDMGTTHYIECPLGRGDCPIAWSSFGTPITTSTPTGTKVSVNAWNWVGRNDRTAKLSVTYQID